MADDTGTPDPQDDAPDDGADTGGRSTPDTGTDELDTLKAKLAELEADRESWKKRSRQNEDRAKQNAAAAREKQTVEEQLEQLRRDIADRDAADIAAKADLAAEKLHAKLVRGGLADEDASALVDTIDTMRLLDEGKPSTAAIDKVAKSLTKIAKRPSADPDQGRRGGDQPPTGMSDLIRRGVKARHGFG